MSFTTNELRGIDRFLYSTLTGNAALTALVGTGVYESVAPEGAATPFVVYGFHSATDVITMGGQFRAFTEPLYRIVAVNQEDGSDVVGQVADAIEAAVTGLQNVTLQPENLTIMGIYRKMPLRLIEEINGKRFSTVGGLFRLLVSRAS